MIEYSINPVLQTPIMDMLSHEAFCFLTRDSLDWSFRVSDSEISGFQLRGLGQADLAGTGSLNYDS